ncbi:MAG: hypothetical protein IJ287_03170 [Methanobrevibacter sp.]|nr:hypothetical protein [Methanobrevibacter sp.]MBR1748880.1 hypothetical protein [Bacilli bacterium]
MYVCIDTREQDRKYQALNYYQNQEEINLAYTGTLPTGDYLFYTNKNKSNEGVVFEYKTIEDFIGSIIDNRVFNQAVDQNLEFTWHYVILVGTNEEKESALHDEFTQKEFNGAIDSLNTITTVVYADTQNEAFYRMLNMSMKCLDGRMMVKRFPKKYPNPAFCYLDYCCYGIGYEKADNIISHLHLQNLDDLLKLTHDKLVEVPGIGDKTATLLLEKIRKDKEFLEDDPNQTLLI